MDIYEHELAAYRVEIEALEREIDRVVTNLGADENCTHLSMGISNRQNMLLVGLCSLVEILLFEYSHVIQEKHDLQIDQINKNGYSKFQEYLKRTESVNFEQLKGWDKFKQMYALRNVIIHSYGGLLETKQIENAREAVRVLRIPEALVGDRRIRVTSKHLKSFHKSISFVVRSLLGGLRACQVKESN